MTSKQKRYSLLVALVLLLGSASFRVGTLWAQSRGDQALRVGSTDLKIGVPKDSVMLVLAADEFSVVQVSGQKQGRPEMYSIMRHPNDETLREAANIYFDRNRLVRVERVLPFDNEHEVLEDIYGLVAKFENAGNRACVLSAKDVNEGDRTLKNATIACGRKSIEIEIWQDNSGKVLMLGVQEVLSGSTLP